jgi:uncharacterized protein with HEPN domain
MENDIKKWLKDILISLENIEKYIGSDKVFQVYDSNTLLQDAVERNLITIGEAMNQILKKSPDIPITNSRKVVDARNRLTHGYDDIENVQVWNIVIKHLPILHLEVKELLGE